MMSPQVSLVKDESLSNIHELVDKVFLMIISSKELVVLFISICKKTACKSWRMREKVEDIAMILSPN